MNKLLFSPVLSDNCILGIGTDICSMQRIEKIYHQFKHKFLMRIFANTECETFDALSDTSKIPYLTKRFACKEAIAKALGTGIGAFAYFTDIACISTKNQPPYVVLTGKTHETALRLAHSNGYDTYKIHISLSDDTDYATAFTVLTGGHHDATNTPA